MRKIDESKITSDKSMFFKQGTWTHLQKAYQEPIAESLKAMIGSGYDATKMYVLNGCINSGSGSSFVISAGSVFYGGEVYLVDAVSFSTTGSNVAVATITTTNNTTDYSADPCEFSDGSLENVHNIRKVVIASGASGSGTKNYSSFDFYPFRNNYKKYDNIVTSSIADVTIDAQKVIFYNDGRLDTYIIANYTNTIAANEFIISVNGILNNVSNPDLTVAGYVPVKVYNNTTNAFIITHLYAISTSNGVVFQTTTALSNSYDRIILHHISNA